MNLTKTLPLTALILAAALLVLATGCRSDEPQDVEDVRQSLSERVRSSAYDKTTYTINEDGNFSRKPTEGLPEDTDVTRGQLQQWRIVDLESQDHELPEDDDAGEAPKPAKDDAEKASKMFGSDD